jgi:hypothetical protein
MMYYFYLRIKMPDGTWARVGKTHEISWDNRDLIKASSGWLIMNMDIAGTATDLYPNSTKELKN